MKKLSLFFISIFLVSSLKAQMNIAVMDFTAGSNMNELNIKGLSEMLINSLYDSGQYDIVERSQIDFALKELNLQGKNLSVSQLTQLGQYLKVDFILVGIVNFIATGNTTDPEFKKGEYNIDVRIVNVKNSRIVATAGVVKSCDQTYRSLMPELASQLSLKLSRKSLPCLQGYLYVFPESLGKGTYFGAVDKAKKLNNVNAHGRNNWRLPSIDELKVISDHLTSLNYEINEYDKVLSGEVFDKEKTNRYNERVGWGPAVRLYNLKEKSEDEDFLEYRHSHIIILVSSD